MTNEQRFVNFSRYFERLINEIELEEERVRNQAVGRRIDSIEYYQKMTELEIRKKTVDEVSKNVLYYVKSDSTY